MFSGFHPSLQSAAAVAVELALKVTVLLALTAGAVLACRRCSAASRHMIRVIGLATALLLPLLTLVLPGVSVGLPVRGMIDAATGATAHPTGPAFDALYGALASSPAPDPEVESGMPANFAAIERPATAVADRAASRRGDGRGATAMASVTSGNSLLPAARGKGPHTQSKPVPIRSRLGLLLLGLPLVWLIGSLLFGARLALSMLRLSRLLRGALRVLDPGLLSLLACSKSGLGLRRPVALLVSGQTDVALAAGCFRPRVVLPPDCVEWPVARRATVLKHELAHVKRYDAITQLVGRLVTAVYWFHPLAWYLARGTEHDRERACDDVVLAGGTAASAYAEDLMEMLSGSRGTGDFALAIACRSRFEGRIRALLDPRVNHGLVTRRAVLLAGVLSFCLLVPVAVVRLQAQPASRAISSDRGRDLGLPPSGAAVTVAPSIDNAPAQAATIATAQAGAAQADTEATPAQAAVAAAMPLFGQQPQQQPPQQQQQPRQQPEQPRPQQHAQTIVQEIRFVGFRTTPLWTLRALISTKPGDSYDPEAVRRDFMALWRTGYFMDISVEVEDGAMGQIITFHLVEKPFLDSASVAQGKFVVWQVQCPAFEQLSPSEQAGIRQRFVGKVVTGSQMTEVAESAGEAFRTFGFFKALVGEPLLFLADNASAVKSQPQRVRLYLDVTPGARYRVKEMKFEGITVLPLNLVEQIFPQAGDTADLVRLRGAFEALQRLYAASGYTNMSAAPDMTFDDQALTISYTIHVTEGAADSGRRP